jgi:transcription-repair coupling factor (superfamily II helicase)
MDEEPAAAARDVPHEGYLPLAIAQWAQGIRQAIFVASDDSMLHALAAAVPTFLPDRAVRQLPAWDNVPYDLSRPSRSATGTRVATLAWLVEHIDVPVIVLTTPEALTQRIPPAERFIERSIRVRSGQPLDIKWLTNTLTAFGYDTVERVDEVGEATIRPGTIDIWPAGAASPLRLDLDNNHVAEIRQFDPDDQRTGAEVSSVLLLPASEAFTVPGEDEEVSGRVAEQILPEGPLPTFFDLLPNAALAMLDGVHARASDWLTLVSDTYKVALASVREGQRPPLAPDRLYLRGEEFAAELTARAPMIFRLLGEPDEQTLTPASAARKAAECRKLGNAVIVCGAAPVSRLRDSLARRLGIDVDSIVSFSDWNMATRSKPEQVGVMSVALRHGFRLSGLVVLAVQMTRGPTAPNPLENPGTLNIGDLVVDPERGLAQLSGLVTEHQAGKSFECLSLSFRGEARRLVPATEAGRVWRYGVGGAVRPDWLDAATWRERREKTESEIQATAVRLVAQTRAREARPAAIIEPTDAYRRFTRLMPFVPTADQARAVLSIRQDLAAGHPMLRLVCGDVGFGKTEVALHAAALVAFAGHQVAVAAPTTLLARQHLSVFRRRLEGFGLRIASLIRSSRSKESRGVLAALSKAEVDIVIGTHAVTGARFRNLGLVVIDEEQRFGEAQKRELRDRNGGVHTLIMTATPLPRTLQSTLVGLVGASLLTQPPASRLPVRSVLVPFDPIVIHSALMREARRGGQSFVVCPRIEDLEPVRARLHDIVPTLSVVRAHGRMRGEELDRVVLDFAAGQADVLLTTNIVETGLDIPNANTMLIWRADRFGLAQLHQLRGRIGRSRVRAHVYLMIDPENPPSDLARRRLEATVSLSHLGAGFDLSVADLEQRGAGDLLGEEQAGHLRLIGTELYRHVLSRAMSKIRGQSIEEEWTPAISMDMEAMVPPEFIPEAETRLEIYRRLGRTYSIDALDEVSAEFADRFGNLPAPFTAFLGLIRLRVLCREQGIAAVHAGPKGVAFTPRSGCLTALTGRFENGRVADDRILIPFAGPALDDQLTPVLTMLAQGSERS